MFAKGVEYSNLSNVEIIVNKSKLDGQHVMVFGYLSRVRWGGFYLYKDKTSESFADRASAIPFYTKKNHLYGYISDNCLDRHVRIKGKIKATDHKKSSYGYLLIIDGIWDMSLKGEPGCHFDFLSDEKAKKLGFKQ